MKKDDDDRNKYRIKWIKWTDENNNGEIKKNEQVVITVTFLQSSMLEGCSRHACSNLLQ